jgi:pyruvate-formate lyase-activating enzyme
VDLDLDPGPESPALPRYVSATLANVALHALGRLQETALHPVAACWLVTYRCELRCLYCLENVRHRCPDGIPRELDTAGALRALAGIRSCCDAIDVSGGEPTARADLADILEACRSLGFREIMLNTNGLRFADGGRELLEPIDCLVVGVDSLREEGFRRITGGTAEQHRAQREALERLYRLQRELRFDLTLCTVIVPGMLGEIEPILRWCFDRGVGLTPSPFIAADLRVHEALRHDPGYRALADRLVDYRRRGLPLLGGVGYYEGLRDLPRFRCLPLSNLTVSPLGELFWPCGELQMRGPSFAEGKPFPQMVAEARARFGPLPECGDRCHFSCRLLLSDLLTRPWQLPGNLLHLRRWRRWSR